MPLNAGNPETTLRLTPLHLAARRGAVEACSALLQGGAAIGARTVDGSTPLHLACALLKASAARLLLRHGADELAVDNAKQTPADVAGLCLSGYGDSKGGREEDHRRRRHEEGFKELLVEIKDGLDRAPADRAWARRGWLIMARARLLRDRRQRGEEGGGGGDDAGGGGGRDGGERLVGKLHDEEGAATAAVVVPVDGVVGDKRARCGDDGTGIDDEVHNSDGKRFGRAAVVVPRSVGDDDDGAVGANRDNNGSLGAIAGGLGLVARVACIKEDGIFHNILSFL